MTDEIYTQIPCANGSPFHVGYALSQRYLILKCFVLLYVNENHYYE
nr:MAG TPA: hypothetical protein [Caudoviricetes sp.]